MTFAILKHYKDEKFNKKFDVHIDCSDLDDEDMQVLINSIKNIQNIRHDHWLKLIASFMEKGE